MHITTVGFSVREDLVKTAALAEKCIEFPFPGDVMLAKKCVEFPSSETAALISSQ